MWAIFAVIHLQPGKNWIQKPLNNHGELYTLQGISISQTLCEVMLWEERLWGWNLAGANKPSLQTPCSSTCVDLVPILSRYSPIFAVILASKQRIVCNGDGLMPETCSWWTAECSSCLGRSNEFVLGSDQRGNWVHRSGRKQALEWWHQPHRPYVDPPPLPSP